MNLLFGGIFGRRQQPETIGDLIDIFVVGFYVFAALLFALLLGLEVMEKRMAKRVQDVNARRHWLRLATVASDECED